jgi:sialidase-1
VFITFSDDDGRTWAKPKEITASTKKPEWTWYATGPGNAIQIRHGKYKGRLVVPCDHNLLVKGKSVKRSHCIFSDDHGKTWKISQPLGDNTNECAVVELADGRLLLNMRSYHGKNRRAVSYSKDGGATWSPVTLDDALIEPVCQGNILRYRWPGDGKRGLIIFSNPASKRRERMTIRLSHDEGKTWFLSRLVYAGSSAYSNLVAFPREEIGLLYERDNYRKITFSRFAKDWADF